MENKDKEPKLYTIQPKDYAKSNVLIGSKYKTHLLEAQIMALSLSRIQYENGEIFSKIKAGELMNLLNENSKAFYRKLDTAAKLMTGRTVGMSNPLTQEFEYHSVITDATYSKGILTINYNNKLQKYITDIKTNFTRLNLEVMLSFENVYAFRLYEIIKSKLYLGNKITIGLAELRFLLGVANAEDTKARLQLSGKTTPDYEKALSLIDDKKQKMYPKYHAFELNVLEPAINDINAKSEFNLSYETIKGNHGKINEILFNVKFKHPGASSNELDEDQKLDIEDEIRDLIAEKISSRDIKSIAVAANYNINQIIAAYDKACHEKEISNLVGYILSILSNPNPDDNVITIM